MARCGCQGASCSCVVTGSGGVTVTGSGSAANPYVVTSDLNVAVNDSSTVDMVLTGDGSDANPYQITSVATIELDELTDVDTAGSATGQVLAKQADGIYRFVAPTTAPAGTIVVGNGIEGDGSAGNPLAVKLAPSSGLISDGTGLRAEGGGVWTAYTPTWTATTTNPTLGNGTLLGFYSQTGKTVHFSIELTIGSTTKRGVGYYRFSPPVPAAANRRMVMPLRVYVVGVAEYAGQVTISNAFGLGNLVIATSTAGSYVTHSTPASLPSGSVITISGTYEAA